MNKNIIKKILREGLMLPYKDLSTPELWFKDLLNQMDIYKSSYYPNSVFFHINKKVYMKYDKNFKILYYHFYKIYSVLESKFGLNNIQINELVKRMVEEHYNLEIDTMAPYISTNFGPVEEHYNLEIDTMCLIFPE